MRYAIRKFEDCVKLDGRNCWGQTYIMQDIPRNTYILGSTICYCI